MPTTTSGIHAWTVAFVDALPALLTAASIDGVQVYSGYMAGSADSIQLIEFDGEQRWGSIGALRREETFTARGRIAVERSGAGETVIRAVRERAFAILAVVEAYLRTAPGQIVGNVNLQAVTRYELDQGAEDRLRWAQLSFEISSEKSLPS